MSVSIAGFHFTLPAEAGSGSLPRFANIRFQPASQHDPVGRGIDLSTAVHRPTHPAPTTFHHTTTAGGGTGLR